MVDKDDIGFNPKINKWIIGSGSEYYLKLFNGDEIYSVTAVYLAHEIKGTLEIDKTESMDLQYFQINELPEGLNEANRNYIVPYLNRIVEKTTQKTF